MWGVVAIAGVFWLIYEAAAIAVQLRADDGPRLDPLTVSLALSGVVLAFASTAYLIDGEIHGLHREGLALLVVAGIQLGLGVAVYRLAPSQRDLRSLLLATGLMVAAVAAAELLTGPSLTLVWAGEAALLSWLAVRLEEPRFRIAAAAYLILALAYTFALEAPLATLFIATPHPADGVPSVVFTAVAMTVFGLCFPRPAASDPDGSVVPFSEQLFAPVEWRPTLGVGAVVLGLYGVSLSLLELAQWVASGDVQTKFEHGHVALSGLWALLALAGIAIGSHRNRDALRSGSLCLLGVAVLEVVAFDLDRFDLGLASYSALCVGVAALLGGFFDQRLSDRLSGLAPAALVFIPIGAGLLTVAIAELVAGTVGGIDVEGIAVLGLGVVYGALAALVFPDSRWRDLSTLLWGIGLLFVAASFVELAAEQILVLLLAATSSGLALLSVVLRERRLQLASAVFLIGALGYAVAVMAPPVDFFAASRHPADGVPSIVYVVLASLVFAWGSFRLEPRTRTTAEWYVALSTPLDDQQARWRTVALWVAGLLSLYAASLSILELAQWAFPGSVSTNFQRGHVAVSAFWALVALALLYAGLRGRRLLRVAGLVLFGLILAKVFLYDLSNLSSVARAFSFLAVGSVFLVGAFFYQRLGSQLEQRRDRPAVTDQPSR